MNTNPLNNTLLRNQSAVEEMMKKNAEKYKTTSAGSESLDAEIPTQTQAPDELILGNADQENYGTYKIDHKKIAEMKQDLRKNTESFKMMVQAMVEKQGFAVNDVLVQLAKGESVSVDVDAETKAAAEEAVSGDGYWGVEKTAARILEFAKTISGGDASKIDLLTQAVKDGFSAAAKAFDDDLPEISSKTYDRVMEGFDDWRKEAGLPTDPE